MDTYLGICIYISIYIYTYMHIYTAFDDIHSIVYLHIFAMQRHTHTMNCVIINPSLVGRIPCSYTPVN